MELEGGRCLFVETSHLMELVDSILVFLCAEESLQVFCAEDILAL